MGGLKPVLPHWVSYASGVVATAGDIEKPGRMGENWSFGSVWPRAVRSYGRGRTVPLYRVPPHSMCLRFMPEPPLHLVLYQPEIPYNAGAVARTCVALGAKLWLVRPLGFQLDDKHMRRAGLDLLGAPRLGGG